jgi:hypothetical protein
MGEVLGGSDFERGNSVPSPARGIGVQNRVQKPQFTTFFGIVLSVRHIPGSAYAIYSMLRLGYRPACFRAVNVSVARVRGAT